MKLEFIIGAVIVGVLGIAGFLYVEAPDMGTISKDVPVIMSAEDKKEYFTEAPELSSIDGFINTGGVPITLAQYRGKKVVLLDIWTYSCINCQRTLPYINDWYEKYRDEGLEVVGLHTPEFAFEKLQENVEDAVKKFKIRYPVVLDNDYSTWNALGNQYWPRKYLIDMDGYIVYDHIGEGGYEETERAIQSALIELNASLGTSMAISSQVSAPPDAVVVDSRLLGSPETYFGALRNRSLANGKPGSVGERLFSLPEKIEPNLLYLNGSWSITPEYAENKGPASVVFKYQAKNVYLVLAHPKGTEIEVHQDGKLLKKIEAQEEDLYHIINDADYGEHLLEIKVTDPGLQAFAFTFG